MSKIFVQLESTENDKKTENNIKCSGGKGGKRKRNQNNKHINKIITATKKQERSRQKRQQTARNGELWLRKSATHNENKIGVSKTK